MTIHYSPLEEGGGKSTENKDIPQSFEDLALQKGRMLALSPVQMGAYMMGARDTYDELTCSCAPPTDDDLKLRRGRWRHKKSGAIYQYVGKVVLKLKGLNDSTGAVYRSTSGDIYCRQATDFIDKFIWVDSKIGEFKKYPVTLPW